MAIYHWSIGCADCVEVGKILIEILHPNLPLIGSGIDPFLRRELKIRVWLSRTDNHRVFQSLEDSWDWSFTREKGTGCGNDNHVRSKEAEIYLVKFETLGPIVRMLQLTLGLSMIYYDRNIMIYIKNIHDYFL